MENNEQHPFKSANRDMVSLREDQCLHERVKSVQKNTGDFRVDDKGKESGSEGFRRHWRQMWMGRVKGAMSQKVNTDSYMQDSVTGRDGRKYLYFSMLTDHDMNVNY